jgi:hypothetical protein
MSLRLTGSGGSVTSQSIVDAGGVTTDETFFHIFDDTSAIADATRKRFACPFDLEVLSFSVWSLVSVAASATDYWTCDLRKFIATDATHTAQLIASKTTKPAPNGEAFAVLTPWTFDAITLDATNRFCVRGDILDVLWTKTLSPTAPSRMSYTLRFRPV